VNDVGEPGEGGGEVVDGEGGLFVELGAGREGDVDVGDGARGTAFVWVPVMAMVRMSVRMMVVMSWPVRVAFGVIAVTAFIMLWSVRVLSTCKTTRWWWWRWRMMRAMWTVRTFLFIMSEDTQRSDRTILVVEGDDLDLDGWGVRMVVRMIVMLADLPHLLCFEPRCTPGPRPHMVLGHIERRVMLVFIVVVLFNQFVAVLMLVMMCVFAMPMLRLVLCNIGLVLVTAVVMLPMVMGLLERNVDLDIVASGLTGRDEDLPDNRTASEDLDLLRRRREVVGELLGAVGIFEERLVEGDPFRSCAKRDRVVRMEIGFR
jgi:hypothetical protein